MNVDEILKTGGTRVPNPAYNKKTAKLGVSPYAVSTNPRDLNRSLGSVVTRQITPSSYNLTEYGDPSKYTEYGVIPNPVDSEAELIRQRSENQSNWEKLGNSLLQATYGEIILGGLEGFANIGEFGRALITRDFFKPDYNFTNPLGAYFADKREQLREDHPIYQRDPNATILDGAMSDPGWWFSNAPSVMSSLSLMIPGAAYGKLLSIGGKALGAAKLASWLNREGRAIKIAANGNKFKKAWGKAVTSLGNTAVKGTKANAVANTAWMAGTSRIGENYQEAGALYRDVYNNTKEIFNSEDFDKEEFIKSYDNPDGTNKWDSYKNADGSYDFDGIAKEIAGEAASRDFAINAGNFFFDFLQFYALRNFVKGFKTKASSARLGRYNREAASNFNKSAEAIAAGKDKRFLLRAGQRAADYLKDSGTVIAAELSEGVEEAVNYVAEQDGRHVANVLLRKEIDNVFDERLKNYLKDGRLYDSAFWGVVGGVVFQGLGSGFNRLSNKIFKTAELSEIESRKAEINKRANKLQRFNALLKEINDGKNIYLQDAEGNNIKFEGSDQEIEIQKASAKQRLIRETVDDLIIDAANDGNLGLLRDYLADPNIQKVFADAGFGEATEISQWSGFVEKEISRIEEKYDDLISFLDDKNVNPLYNRIIATDILRKKLNVESLTEDINALDDDIESELNTFSPDESLDESRRAHYDEYRLGIRRQVFANQLRLLYEKREELAKTNTISARYGLKNINRQIDAIEKFLIDNEDWVYGTYDALTPRGQVTSDEAIRRRDEFLEEKYGEQLSDTGFRTSLESEFQQEIDKGRQAFVRLSSLDEQLAQMYAARAAHELTRVLESSDLQLTDKYISDYVEELNNWFDRARKKVLDEASNTINDLMIKYDPLEVFDYINNNRTSDITDITEEDKRDLDTAINALELSKEENEGIIASLSRMAERAAIIRAARKVENRNVPEPENPPTVPPTGTTNPANSANPATPSGTLYGGYKVGEHVDYTEDDADNDDVEYARKQGRALRSKTFGVRNPFTKSVPVRRGLVIGQYLDPNNNKKYLIVVDEENEDDYSNDGTLIFGTNVEDYERGEYYTYVPLDQVIGKSTTTDDEVKRRNSVSRDIKGVSEEVKQDLAFTEPKELKVGDTVRFIKSDNPEALTEAIDTHVRTKRKLDLEIYKKTTVNGEVLDVDDDADRAIGTGKITAIDEIKDSDGKIAKRKYTIQTEDGTWQAYDSAIVGTVDETNDNVVPESNQKESIDDDSLYTEAMSVFGQQVKAATAIEFEEKLNEARQATANALLSTYDITEETANNAAELAYNKLKPILARTNRLTYLVADLYLTDSTDASGYTKAYKNAVLKLIDEYLNLINRDKIGNRRFINASAFIRYLKASTNNKDVIDYLFKDLIDFLRYTNNLRGPGRTIVLTDTAKDLSDAEFLARTDKTLQEIQEEELGKDGSHRIDIYSVFENVNNTERKNIADAIANLKKGDRLEYTIDDGRVLFKINDTVIGSVPVPEVENGVYHKFNDGWNTDISVVNGVLQSNFISFLQNTLGNFNTNLYNIVSNYVYGDIDAKTQAVLDFINSGIKQQAIRLGLADNNSKDTDMLDGLAKLLAYTSEASTEQEVKDSLYRWGMKLNKSYTAVNNLLNDTAEVVVDYVTEGELIDTLREGTFTPVQEAVANLSPATHKIVIGVNGGVMIASGNPVGSNGEIQTNVFGNNRTFIYKGRTYITIPNRSGSVSYISVSPIGMKSDQIGNDAKSLIRAIKTAIWNHVKNDNFDNLRNFLLSVLPSNRNNGVSLFRLSEKYDKGVAFDGVSNKGVRYVGIKFGDNSEDALIFYENGVYNFKRSQNSLNVLKNGSTINSLLDNIFNRFNFQIEEFAVRSDSFDDYSFVNSILSKKDGKFVISFDKGDGTQFRLEYNSFNEFVVNNNLINAATRIDPESGTNFNRAENGRSKQRVYVKYVTKTSSPVEGIAIPNTRLDSIVQNVLNNKRVKNKSKGIINKLINVNSKLNNLFKLDIWTNDIIFVNENIGVVADTERATGQIRLGNEFIELAGKNPKAAVNALLHENIHALLTRDRVKSNELINRLTDVHAEFIDSLTDEHIKEYADAHGYDFDKVKTELQKLIAPYGVSANSNVEEFLVTSMTNKFVSDYLNETKSKKEGTNLLAEIWSKLLEWLGVNVNKGSILAREINILAGETDSGSVESVNPSTGGQTQLEINFGDDSNQIENEQNKENESEQAEQETAVEGTYDENGYLKEETDDDEDIDVEDYDANQSFNYTVDDISLSESVPSIEHYIETFDAKRRPDLRAAINNAEISIVCK